MNDYAVGIDLGTTTSSIAICCNDTVEIIDNELGEHITPSWVCFADDQIFVGSKAKEIAHKYIKNTIFESKRLIGQKYGDPKVARDIERLCYDIFDDLDSPKIRVQRNNTTEEYFPEEICGFILKNLKLSAERYIKTNITKAVVTVPVHYEREQIEGIKQVGKLAGFHEITTLSEPLAAAYAYLHTNKCNKKKNILVYDFGGGTFDVSIVQIVHQQLYEKASIGEPYLGGMDIDGNICQHVMLDYQKQFGYLPEKDEDILRLKSYCEGVKHKLSTSVRANIDLDSLAGNDYNKPISRALFEDMNIDLFQKTISLAEKCMEKASLRKSDIDEIVLVGGSSRIPKIKELIEATFPTVPICGTVDPGVAIAYGAAVYAAILTGDKAEVEDEEIIETTVSTTPPISSNTNTTVATASQATSQTTQVKVDDKVVETTASTTPPISSNTNSGEATANQSTNQSTQSQADDPNCNTSSTNQSEAVNDNGNNIKRIKKEFLVSDHSPPDANSFDIDILNSMNHVVIGIDLGTSNSCVAVCLNGTVEIVLNDKGERTTPSWVTFIDDTVKVGSDAKDIANEYPTTTVYEWKRLMGQEYEDNEGLLQDIKRLPYEIFNDLNTPKIKIRHQETHKDYYPEEISGFILKNLKADVQRRFGKCLANTVVTVPAYFNEPQREATRNAALLAGFQDVAIIDEPVAAVYAYLHQNKDKARRNLLVYDFGGGTFDVSVVNIENGKCQIKNTKGDPHLGGTDVDWSLCDFIKEDFVQRHGKVFNIENDRRLKTYCENIKSKLSYANTANVELDEMLGKDYKTMISRVKLEELNQNLFNRTINIVEECINESGLSKEDIDEVALVGGSTKIPSIKAMIKSYLPGAILLEEINPDEAVAIGAAAYAAELKKLAQNEITFSDAPIIGTHFKSSMPLSTNKIYNVTKLNLLVRPKTQEVEIYQLSGCNKFPNTSIIISLSFDLDSNGKLHVRLTEEKTKKNTQLSVNVKQSSLAAKEVENFISKSNSMKNKKISKARSK